MSEQKTEKFFLEGNYAEGNGRWKFRMTCFSCGTECKSILAVNPKEHGKVLFRCRKCGNVFAGQIKSIFHLYVCPIPEEHILEVENILKEVGS